MPRLSLLVAALCAASCSHADAPFAPTGAAVARAVESPVGNAGQGVLHCSREGRGCRPLVAGERFDADAQIRTTRGARATLVLDDETEVAVEDEAALVVAEELQLDRGTLTLRAPGGARPRTLRFVDRALVTHAAAPATLAVRAAAADRATVTVHQGRATLEAEQGAAAPGAAAGAGAIELRAGDTVEVTLGRPADVRAALAGRAAPVEAAPLRTPDDRAAEPAAPSGREDERTAPARRGLGTMTARVPGTTEVVSGVRLVSHKVTVTVKDAFARTEVEEEFENETARVLEGRYAFPLPPDAGISRLALWVGATLVEGEIVERKRAANIFQSIVEDSVRPRDPALLEWVTGGEFALKVYPIPARGRRKVVLAYDQALVAAGGRVRYVYPLSLGEDRATAIDDFAITLTASDERSALSDVSTPRYPATIQTGDRRVVASYGARAFVPGGDFVVSFQRDADGAAQVSTYVPTAQELASAPKAGGSAAAEVFAAVRVGVDLPEGLSIPEHAARDRAVIVDTSYSQSAETLAGAVAVAMGIVRRMEPDEHFVLLACDSACATYPEDGLARADDDAVDAAEAWLGRAAPSGSSDLAGALLAAARRLPPAGRGQIVYLGDGAATSGELGARAIAERARPAIAERGADLRLLGSGRTVDEVALQAIARDLGGAYDRVATGEALARRVDELALGLRQPVVASPRLELPDGLYDVRPAVLPNLRLGQEIVLAAKLDPSRALGPITLAGELGGKPYARSIALALPDVPGRRQNPLVPRLWAQARLAELDASTDKAAIDEAVALSRRFHVMSRATSLLVLENDRMFAEFGVERTTRRADDQSDALFGADAAEAGGVVGAPPGAASPGRLGGSAAPAEASAPAPRFGMLYRLEEGGSEGPRATGNLWGGPSRDTNGGLGLSGIGEGGGGKGEGIGLGAVGNIGHGAGSSPGQGFGSGSGRLGGSHRARAPQVRSSASAVSGRLPTEVIQRVVRSAFGRFRQCYERGLAKNPALGGRVTVRFIIRSEGGVGGVESAGSDLADAEVVACVVGAFRGLSFPSPESGTVTVVFPIVFKPADAAPTTSAEPPPSAPVVASPSPAPSPRAPRRAPPAWVPEPPDVPTAAHRSADDAWMRDRDATLDDLQAKVAQAPTSRPRHEALVRRLLARGRLPEALEAARRFAELDPDLPRARELYAFALAATGDGPAAVAALDSLAETSPRSAAAHARAARAFEAAGDERRACAHWRSLAELRPGADDALAEALRCRARVLGERQEALALAKAKTQPGPALAKLAAALEGGSVPAYETPAARGQFEATVRCEPGVERCPAVVVIGPTGNVMSPWTPSAERSGARSVSFSGLQNGTYRTLLVGGAPDARGEVELSALGSRKRLPITRASATVAATLVQIPATSFGWGGRF